MPSIVNEFSAFDAEMMARALSLARKGIYSTTPNPHVGCVLVSPDGNIIAEGFHQKAGDAHAEVNALQKAGTESIGATAYVTLEPCSHQGKTGPCALALIDAKIQKVIIACRDPNPNVNGSGIDMLQEAGIEVSIGLMESTALKINAAFFTRMHLRRPLITVKLAASLDGKTALASGESQWITSKQARTDVQHYRASACAILSGADTVIADNPKLNVRPNELKDTIAEQFSWRDSQPLRVIIDSRNRLSREKYEMFNDGQACLVYNSNTNFSLGTENTGPVRQQQVGTINIDDREYLDLNIVLADLADKGINHLWVEAGAKLSGALFDLDVVDNLVLYQAPKILGSSAKGLTHASAKNSLDEALCGEVISVSKVGPDIKTLIKFSHLNTTGT
jgi:diaminohydroxyphosphoribosylaminopyrimidine deaminase/5-amino-6-(5-phosphoribosylamino)uracil reductase